MLKKQISYTDFNGLSRTEDFYFNLTQGELAEWELTHGDTGGLERRLTAIIESNDGKKIMDAFREIITRAYGVKSDDGRSFIKTPEIAAGFLGSEAYSVLFMELIQNPEAAAKFINALVPQNLVDPSKKSPQDHKPKHASPPSFTSVPDLPTENHITPNMDRGERDRDYQAYLEWRENQSKADFIPVDGLTDKGDGS